MTTQRGKYSHLRRPWRLTSKAAIDSWELLPEHVREKILAMQGPNYREPKPDAGRRKHYAEIE